MDREEIDKMMVNLFRDLHIRTCMKSTEEIQEFFRKNQAQDPTKILHYKKLTRQQLWLECAEKLSTVVDKIAEFAKWMPGFKVLFERDQNILLKDGTFDLAILRMSRYLDLQSNCVIFGNVVLPQNVFVSENKTETMLVTRVFEFAKSIVELKLNDAELGLYSAAIIFNPARPGLIHPTQVRLARDDVIRVLQAELERNQHLNILEMLKTKIKELSDISLLHKNVLNKLKWPEPYVDFLDLHKKLFNADIRPHGVDSDWEAINDS